MVVNLETTEKTPEELRMEKIRGLTDEQAGKVVELFTEAIPRHLGMKTFASTTADSRGTVALDVYKGYLREDNNVDCLISMAERLEASPMMLNIDENDEAHRGVDLRLVLDGLISMASVLKKN